LGRCSPWKVPLGPLTVRPFRCLRCPLGTGMTGRGDLGMPPLRRTPTLAHMFRQATTKRHFEHSAMQFSAGCCLNDTSLETDSGHALTPSEAAIMRYNTLNSQNNLCRPGCGHTPHPDRRVSVNGYSNENGVNAHWGRATLATR